MDESAAVLPAEPIPPTPPPPKPASDPHLTLTQNAPPVCLVDQSGSSNSAENNLPEIFRITPREALKLLADGIEALVQITGDVPPLPPSDLLHMPNMRGITEEKAHIVRSNSERNLALYYSNSNNNSSHNISHHNGQNSHTRNGSSTTTSKEEAPLTSMESPTKRLRVSSPTPSPLTIIESSPSSRRGSSQATPLTTDTTPTHATALDTITITAPTIETDGIQLRHPPPSPTAAANGHVNARKCSQGGEEAPGNDHVADPSPQVIVGQDQLPTREQHGAITRKFYSKNPPKISIAAYLERVDYFCPMSTAVYLATSLALFRLAVEERAVAITPRNVHRLLLAGLRVSMKALEDLSYAHSRIAKVGGVTEAELARLEISFCFLTNFELVPSAEALQAYVHGLRDGSLVERFRRESEWHS